VIFSRLGGVQVPIKKRSIGGDLSVGISLTIVTVTVTLSLLWYFFSITAEKQRLETRATDMADKLVAVLRLPLWNVDHEAVRLIADAYAQTENVVALRIVDDTGEVVYEVQPYEPSEQITVSRTVRHRSQDIGHVLLSLTTHELLTSQKHTLVLALAIMACVTLAVMLVIRMLLRVFLAKPLNELTQGLQTIAGGAYEHFLPSVKQRDVDAIIEEVNAMAAQIHERDRALRESKMRYEELANLLPETIYETDTEGGFTFLSRSGFEAFRLEPKDLDEGLRVEHLFVESERQRVREDLERIKAGERVGATEYTARRKDGSRFPVLVHSSGIVRNGGVMGVRAIAVDITDRKRLEEELTRLAEGIAHQVRNPVMTIGGFALRLQQRYAEDEDPQNWLRIILAEVQRLERMVADIHEFIGLRDPEPRDVSVPSLLIALLAERGSQLEPKGIRLTRDIPEGLPPVLVDRDLVGMALEKVMENAIEAMPEGGDLTIRAHTKKSYVCIAMEDTGVGVPAEDLPNVFDPFYGSKPLASGLGLTTAQKILNEQNATLRLDSTPGKGTIAEICLLRARTHPSSG
jgi:PAS domain S-box-containing protein